MNARIRMSTLGIFSLLMIGLLAFTPSPAQAITALPAAEKGSHDDVGYTFNFDFFQTTDGVTPRGKKDNSSVFVNLKTINISDANLYVDGRNQNGEYVNCMGGTTANVTRNTAKGNWRIQSLVYERFKNYGAMAQLTGWGKGNTGSISGVWSPDSYTSRGYPFLNGTPNPNIW